jgi:hypothetical protein
MTKFISIDKDTQEKKETVFIRILSVRSLDTTLTEPNDWDNVMHIGKDVDYGDVFKCWNENVNNFTLYFGTKGDEFN